MFRSLQFILLLLLLLPACDRSLRATDYDQSCEIDDDCFAVEEGDVCYRCGAQTAAINVQEVDRFNDDRNDKAGGCVLWASGDSDCFCENESVVACRVGQCELAQSNCAEVIEPPTFVLTSPRFSDPLPPNVQFRGHLEPSTDDSEVVDVKIVGLTEDRPLTVTTGHCATRNGCELVMDPGGLPAGASLALAFTFDVEERHAFSVGDELDTTAPFVSPLLSPTTEVSVDRDEAGNAVFQMDIGLSRPEALSDEGIAGAALERSLDGGPPLLVERYEATARGGIVVDTIFEREKAERACYRYLAWDPSGNEAFSEPLCLDVAINDGNKPKTGCGAGPAGGAVTLTLLVLLGRRDGIRRRGRVKKTCAFVEAAG